MTEPENTPLPTENAAKYMDVEAGKMLAGRAGNGLMVLGALIAICFGAMRILDGESVADALGFSWLLGVCFLWTIALGALFFIGLNHLTHSIWSVVVRRQAEFIAFSVLATAIVFIPVLLQVPALYEWVPGEEALDAIVAGKTAYLNRTFFSIRAIVFLLIWVGFMFFYVRGSFRQDTGACGMKTTARMRKVSAPFMMLFAVTITFASFDWIMSLEPRWFSTIFGVYIFAGMTLSAHAMITLLVVWLRARGVLKDVINADHLYSLGLWMFGWSCFWGYIAVSQLLLIWYANLPEESFWFVDRWNGGWKYLSLGLLVMRFFVPFFLLLSQGAKSNPRILVAAAILLLVGQALDLFWLIMPEAPVMSGLEYIASFGLLIFMAGLLLGVVGGLMKKHAVAAHGDPHWEASTKYHL